MYIAIKEFYIQTNEYPWYLPVLATPFSIFFKKGQPCPLHWNDVYGYLIDLLQNVFLTYYNS
jgi:hypothetical protein